MTRRPAVCAKIGTRCQPASINEHFKKANEMRFVTRAPRFLPVVGGALMMAIATISLRVPDLRIAASEPPPQAAAQGTSAGRPLKVLFLGSDQAPGPAGQTPPAHQASGFYQAVATTLARKG